MGSTEQSVWDLVGHVWILGLPLTAWALLLAGLFCIALGGIYIYMAWWRRTSRFWDSQPYEGRQGSDWSSDWWDQ